MHVSDAPETLAQEFARLVSEYTDSLAPPSTQSEAWNLIADFAVSNSDEIKAALLSALAPVEPEPVAVKPLGWEDFRADGVGHIADTVTGRYVIEMDSLAATSWQLRFVTMKWEDKEEIILVTGHLSEEAAQSAAQAHFDASIRSALASPAPSPEGGLYGEYTPTSVGCSTATPAPSPSEDDLIAALKSDKRSLAYTVANIRQGQSSTPRCEEPGEADIEIAMKWVGWTIDAIALRTERARTSTGDASPLGGGNGDQPSKEEPS